MKRANSKLAALTLITTLAVATFASTTAHANDNINAGDQTVAGKHKPITEEQLQRAIGNRNPNSIQIQAKFENTNLKNQGITLTGKAEIPSKSSENSSWFWNLWTRFKEFVKGSFS
ncbi:hypothetical protein [Streptococcus suis]|uniref:hypothetical protein n=1 Tax=Streptococcus suis TaxID=1307 RepID=UPI0007C1AA84|nr:hypothetical protein [Streptococcus suis]AND00099.1 hypothetical protein A6M16_06205 [Streptococcus suis]AOM74815.1 hypothetical protein BFP66_06100 [Streptococcus suis]MBS8059234.1 hypothetical protein [Streptococcus suis]MBS8114590.1 hypothetical protein [Streptococcus suis]MBY5027856.1 hypothetical protein [Streptococcus suis]